MILIIFPIDSQMFKIASVKISSKNNVGFLAKKNSPRYFGTALLHINNLVLEREKALPSASFASSFLASKTVTFRMTIGGWKIQIKYLRLALHLLTKNVSSSNVKEFNFSVPGAKHSNQPKSCLHHYNPLFSSGEALKLCLHIKYTWSNSPCKIFWSGYTLLAYAWPKNTHFPLHWDINMAQLDDKFSYI